MKLSKWLIILVLTTGILAISTSATLIRLASQSAFRSGVELSLVIAASRGRASGDRLFIISANMAEN